MKLHSKKIAFVKSAISPKDFPSLKDDRGKPLPEIALVGRSNVGKSSLLNDLFHTDIVRTSSVPGKTQLIQFFKIENQLSIADLPGYGYAKVPLEVRKSWGPMIQKYLTQRASLNVLLFLFDIRRDPSEEDIQLVEWMSQTGKSFILILTKTDKLTKAQATLQAEKIRKALRITDAPYVSYSVTKNIGRHDLEQIILGKLDEISR